MAGRNFLPIHASKKRVAGDSSDWTRMLKMSAMGAAAQRIHPRQLESSSVAFSALGGNIRGAIERFKASVGEPALAPAPADPSDNVPPPADVAALWVAAATIAAGTITSAFLPIVQKLTGGFLMALGVGAGTSGSAGTYSTDNPAAVLLDIAANGSTVTLGPSVTSSAAVTIFAVATDASGRTISVGRFSDDVASMGVVGTAGRAGLSGFVACHTGATTDYIIVFQLSAFENIETINCLAVDTTGVYVADYHGDNDGAVAISRTTAGGLTSDALANFGVLAAASMVKLNSTGAVVWANRFDNLTDFARLETGASTDSVWSATAHDGALDTNIFDYVGAPHRIVDGVVDTPVFGLATRYNRTTGAPTGCIALRGVGVYSATTLLCVSGNRVWAGFQHGTGTANIESSVDAVTQLAQIATFETDPADGIQMLFLMVNTDVMAHTHVIQMSDGMSVLATLSIDTATGKLILAGTNYGETLTVWFDDVVIDTTVGAMGPKNFVIVLDGTTHAVLSKSSTSEAMWMMPRSTVGAVGTVVQSAPGLTFGTTAYTGTSSGALAVRLTV